MKGSFGGWRRSLMLNEWKGHPTCVYRSSCKPCFCARWHTPFSRHYTPTEIRGARSHSTHTQHPLIMQSVKVETFVPPTAPTTLLPNFWASACDTASRAGHALAKKMANEFYALETVQPPITEMDRELLAQIDLSRYRQRQTSSIAMPSVSLTIAAGARIDLLDKLQTELRENLQGGLTEKALSAHADLVRLVPIWVERRISLIRIEVDMRLHFWDEGVKPRLVEGRLIRGDVPIQAPQLGWNKISDVTLGTDGQSFQSQAHTAHTQSQIQDPSLNLSDATDTKDGSGFILGGVINNPNTQVDLSMLQGLEQPVPPNPALRNPLSQLIPSFNIEDFGANFREMRESLHYPMDARGYGSEDGNTRKSINNSPALSATSGDGVSGLADLFLTSRPPSRTSNHSLESFNGA
jgi:hypothetical protein